MNRDPNRDAASSYPFGPTLSLDDAQRVSDGQHTHLWHVLGARVIEHEGTKGIAFTVWAPNAERVSVVGDFNDWDGRRHVMRRCGDTGVFEILVPELRAGERYKYAIIAPDGTTLPLKADPVAMQTEAPPATASITRSDTQFVWTDQAWLVQRGARQRFDKPISIYEVHLASWRRAQSDANAIPSYRELAETLVPYVADLGFTHIEVLPIAEYPFGGSWGYQPTALFAPTARHGSPDDFRSFVDACHQAGLGLIIDWVPGHFPTDAHGLGRFDGTPLYEYADPREGFHQDWNTYIYDYGRPQVRNYLISNARYWLEDFHVDGLRVDAVASMLYRDYSRKDGEWIPNIHGGRENLEAIDFLKTLNTTAYGADNSIITVAEESTAWPSVSRPVHDGGLGFGFKWNMGWMHDTLQYMKLDPIHRKHHHNLMTFGMHYAFSENFVLALSHDEVVHGKGSLLSRMPGSENEKFANLRAYFAFMWAHPGKKLLFMGGEFGQYREWDHDRALDWNLLDDPRHAGLQRLIRDLNELYRSRPALHEQDHQPEGFQWLQGGAENESVLSWLRLDKEGRAPILCIFNFTPIERRAWRVGAPVGGSWRTLLNTHAVQYGGKGDHAPAVIESMRTDQDGQPFALNLTLPPLSALILAPETT